MEQELKDLMQEQKKQREKLKVELKIKKIIQDKTLIPFKIFITDLYGVSAWITFKDEFRKEGANKQELNKLLDLFKPYKMFLSGGNSFRPTENPKEENKPINPYIIKYDGFDGDVFIIWFTKQQDNLIEIKVKVNREIANEILNVDYERREFKGGFEIINTRLYILGNFDDAQYKYIRWGRGTEQYPNDFTIYTENLQTDFKDYLNT